MTMTEQTTAIVFPGQGAQYVGMGQANAENWDCARKVFEEADAILGLPLSQVCFEGPAEQLDRTDISQPAIFTTSVAALAAYKERHGKLPDCALTAGLSLGEYTALHHAGALSFADGLKLVRARGEAMQAACDVAPSGMTSVIGMARELLEEICEEVRTQSPTLGVICLANINSPQQIVLTGDLTALALAGELAQAKGAKKVIPLTVAGAFHSPLMAPAADMLARALDETEIKAPCIPVVCNVTARPTTDPAQIRQLLLDQLTHPVEWVRGVEAMIAAGVETFVEFGPGRVLTGLLKRIDRSKTGKSIDLVEKE